MQDDVAGRQQGIEDIRQDDSRSVGLSCEVSARGGIIAVKNRLTQCGTTLAAVDHFGVLGHARSAHRGKRCIGQVGAR